MVEIPVDDNLPLRFKVYKRGNDYVIKVLKSDNLLVNLLFDGIAFVVHGENWKEDLKRQIAIHLYHTIKSRHEQEEEIGEDQILFKEIKEEIQKVESSQ